MWNLKYDTNEPTHETKTETQTQRTDWRLPQGRGWEREKGLPTRDSALPPGPGKKKHFAKVTVGLLHKRKEVYEATLDLSAQVYV